MSLAPTMSEDYVMDTPLPRLLAELDVEIVEVPVDEETFCGHAEVRRGRIKLSVSSRWTETVRDGMARALLAVALGIPRPPLPAPFEISEI